MIRIRMSQHDAHYGGGLIDGARILNLFGDVATELLIKYDGDEGLFRAYTNVDFLVPVYAGDYIEAEGSIIKVGNTSRTMEFAAWKVAELKPEISDSAAEMLKDPILVCKATGICVTPFNKQRIKHEVKDDK